jgi:hypothetical protein
MAFKSEPKEENWYDSILDSSIARLSIGIVSLFILIRICTKRGARSKRQANCCNHQHSGNTIKFSNSCFEEHPAIDETVHPPTHQLDQHPIS